MLEESLRLKVLWFWDKLESEIIRNWIKNFTLRSKIGGMSITLKHAIMKVLKVCRRFINPCMFSCGNGVRMSFGVRLSRIGDVWWRESDMRGG